MKLSFKKKPKKILTDEEKEKSKFEWLILFFICSTIPFKCYAIYETSGGANMQMLLISAFAIILWLISGAKAGLFNIFLSMRRLKSKSMSWFKILILDLKVWQLSGERLKYTENDSKLDEEIYD